jgi:hypothetical protein
MICIWRLAQAVDSINAELLRQAWRFHRNESPFETCQIRCRRRRKLNWACCRVYSSFGKLGLFLPWIKIKYIVYVCIVRCSRRGIYPQLLVFHTEPAALKRSRLIMIQHLHDSGCASRVFIPHGKGARHNRQPGLEVLWPVSVSAGGFTIAWFELKSQVLWPVSVSAGGLTFAWSELKRISSERTG